MIRRTQDTLGKVIRKPPLTDKLLGKPPFRYLHDILSEVIRTAGFFKGLYTESELKSENVKEKDSKISFLQKAIDVVVLVTGEPLSVKPARIVAGHEPEKTNEFLQAIGKCCLNKLSSDDAVKRVLSGEKLESKGKPPSNTKSQDKENREAKDEERRSQREKEDRRESEIRERSGSRDRKDRQKDEERKHSEREKKKERERVGETEKDGLQGEKNDREKNRVKEPRPETDRTKEKVRDRERRSEGSHGKERDRTRDKEKVRDRGRGEHEKERNLEKEGDPEDRSRERDKERGDRNRDERTRTREQDKERRRERDSERRKERVKDNEHKADGEEKPEEEMRSERKHKTSEESTKKIADISAREERQSVSSKAARPSASKLRERKPAKLGGEAADSASDGEGRDTEAKNTENEASDGRTNLSAQRRIPRPGSARPAPPRVKRQPSTDLIVPERVGSGKGVSSVIVEKQKDDGDDDNEFVVEEASPQLSHMPAMEMESELDLAADEKHGSLVKKILETKKEFETQPDSGSKGKAFLTDNGRKKEKDMVTKEIGKLRSSIQIVCRSALPLGKIMDYIQEDMDTMKNELQMWRKENSEHAEVLLREQSITDSAVEPLKAELVELEQLINEQRDRICTVKGNILRNEEKIQKMVQSMSGSNRD